MVFRSRAFFSSAFRRLAILAGVVGLGVLSGCRYETIWTGAELSDSGSRLKLAAAEPLCGCLQISNTSSQPIFLRSQILDSPLGTLTLQPHEHAKVQFDWGGPKEQQVYEIDFWTRNGQPLKAQDVIHIDDTGWPWHACDGSVHAEGDDKSCVDGSLKLQHGRAGKW